MFNEDALVIANRFFQIAVQTGVESAVRVHIDRGDNVNARNKNGQTLLMIAASRNKAAICKLLMESNAIATLVDPSGKDALTIAKLAGAHEAATVIQEVINTTREKSVAAVSDEEAAVPSLLAGHSSPSPYAEPVFDIDSLEPFDSSDAIIDLSAWVADEDGPAPEGDASLAIPATALHFAISDHTAFDSTEDWDDFDIFLPSFAVPILRVDNAEKQDQLRLLLLRAIREASVPAQLVEELCRNDDQSRNQNRELSLAKTINNLGAEVDERFEYQTNFDNFLVFVDAHESEHEMAAVDDAIAYFDSLVSSEEISPFIQKARQEFLITAADEIALARAMESTVETALDALAAWPYGVCALVRDAALIASGEKPLRWMVLESHEAEPTYLDNGGDELDVTETEKHDVETPSDSSSVWQPSVETGLASMLAKIAELSQLPASNVIKDQNWGAIRKVFGSFAIQKSYLLALSDEKTNTYHPSAKLFASAIAEHKRARERMALANLRLVLTIAKRYSNFGMPLEDLIQEGNIGLLKGVERFDWRKGFKFSTYATWWIRQQISRAVADKSQTIRLPVHFYQTALLVKQAAASWEAIHDARPSLSQMGNSLNLPEWKIEAALRENEPYIQLDATDIDDLINFDVNTHYVSPDPSEAAESKELHDIVGKLLDGLTNIQRKVIQLRFGIGSHKESTLEEVGSMFDLTRERIRQVEAKTLRILRRPIRAAALADWAPRKLPVDYSPDAIETDNNDAQVHIEASANIDDHDNENNEALKISAARGADASAATERLGSNGSEEKALVQPMPRPLSKSGSKVLNRLFDEARSLGFEVVDLTNHPSGLRAHVNIHEAKDGKTRSLIRKLIENGFTYSNGEGYIR